MKADLKKQIDYTLITLNACIEYAPTLREKGLKTDFEQALSTVEKMQAEIERLENIERQYKVVLKAVRKCLI